MELNWQQENEIESWLTEHVGKEVFKDGLLRFKKSLGNYPDLFRKKGIKVITIAGTNGKGETTLALSHLLQAMGKKHTVWISPHVMSIRERILQNGEEISYERLLSCLKLEYKRLQESSDSAENLVSYYELMLLAFARFTLECDPIPEYALLEVGIGGRLDGVNLFEPTLTAITSISRDHEDLLGRGYQNILREKLGIARAEVPLITCLESAYCRHLAEKWCLEKNIPWVDLFQLGNVTTEDSFSVRNYQLAHALKETILGTSDALKKNPDFIFPTFKGRKEEMTLGKRRFIFIGSHNLDGIRKLVAWVCGERKKGKKTFNKVLASLSKRSYPEEPKWMLKALKGMLQVGEKIYLASFDHHKALGIAELKQLCAFDENLSWIDDWKKFVQDDHMFTETILVTGSYYFVGEVERYLSEIASPPNDDFSHCCDFSPDSGVRRS